MNQPATPAVNLATDDLRHERKLLPAGYALPEVLALIRQHPSGFHEVYPPRWVNNLYLDSHSLDDYHDHVTGLAERSKSRIRWYGAGIGLAIMEERASLSGGQFSVQSSPGVGTTIQVMIPWQGGPESGREN